MTLLDRAVVVIEAGSETGTFEFQAGLEHQTEVTKNYLMAERGQYIREVVNQTILPESAGEGKQTDRRTGYWIDGGAGEWPITLNFQNGPQDDVDWGDGSGGTGASNVTDLDASGKGCARLSRINVLNHWIAKTRTDSFGQAFCYWGEWADGTFASSAGAMNAPMPIAIRSVTGNTDVRDPAVYEGALEFSHITPFPDAGVPDRLSGSVTDFIGQIQDALSGNPDG